MLVASALGLLAPLTACAAAIRGQWHLVRAEPGAEVFAVDDAAFGADGTFEATLTLDGATQRVRGTYEYNGWRLVLRPEAGGQRTFHASVTMGRLRIIDGERRAILEKGSR